MEITKGKIQKAKKVVIYGPEGIGKSTFAARFPGAVFIDTEGSTNDMDVARLPRPTSWNMLFDEIEYIKTHTDECRTLVIDTVDWAELLCVEHICAVHNKKGIEDFGYGNGYVYTKEEFGRFLPERYLSTTHRSLVQSILRWSGMPEHVRLMQYGRGVSGQNNSYIQYAVWERSRDFLE